MAPVNRDVRVKTSVPQTGLEGQGVFNPFRDGTRLYLSLPDGRRIGFTFQPQKIGAGQIRYYKPAWSGGPGADYLLASVDATLIKAGSRFYEALTGQPYHPAEPAAFDGFDYTLTGPDGTVYRVQSDAGDR